MLTIYALKVFRSRQSLTSYKRFKSRVTADTRTLTHSDYIYMCVCVCVGREGGGGGGDWGVRRTLSKIELCPIQFAHCAEIESNGVIDVFMRRERCSFLKSLNYVTFSFI